MNSQRPQHMRPSAHATRQLRHRSTPIVATICALAVVLAGVAAYGWHVGWFAKSTSNGNTTTPQTSQTSALPRADVPSPKKNEPAAQAQRAVSAMTLEERVGQLVMVPLFAGSEPSSLASTIADEHIGSAILIGNWNTGVDTVKTAAGATPRICAGRQSSHHRHRSGGWSGTASDWYRFRHNAQCR